MEKNLMDYSESIKARAQREVAKRKKHAPRRWTLKFMRRDVMGDKASSLNMQGYTFTEIAYALSKTRCYVKRAIDLRM